MRHNPRGSSSSEPRVATITWELPDSAIDEAGRRLADAVAEPKSSTLQEKAQ
ncbi:MAG: hypothetical protein QOD24_2531 [Solirubrobacteraceae bacterium]|nr:hypothetical protein [Solirubrobacteraceae bacterium]